MYFFFKWSKNGSNQKIYICVLNDSNRRTVCLLAMPLKGVTKPRGLFGSLERKMEAVPYHIVLSQHDLVKASSRAGSGERTRSHPQAGKPLFVSGLSLEPWASWETVPRAPTQPAEHRPTVKPDRDVGATASHSPGCQPPPQRPV